MAIGSNIGWTDATLNGIAGCNDLSSGCKNCYAREMTGRLEAMGQPKYTGLTVLQGSHRVWTGKINFDEKALLAPLKRKKPTRYFVNSMSDLFHKNVSDEIIDKHFAVFALCPQHQFQILTKRPERQMEYMQSRAKSVEYWESAARGFGYTFKWTNLDGKEMSTCPFPLKNVWLGTSTENQATADERIPFLLQTPAAVRFISAEPLLGEINIWAFLRGKIRDESLVALRSIPMPGLDWVVVGAESGSEARPMELDWLLGIVNQCKTAKVPVFVKQDGGLRPGSQGRIPDDIWAIKEFPA